MKIPFWGDLCGECAKRAIPAPPIQQRNCDWCEDEVAEQLLASCVGIFFHQLTCKMQNFRAISLFIFFKFELHFIIADDSASVPVQPSAAASSDSPGRIYAVCGHTSCDDLGAVKTFCASHSEQFPLLLLFQVTKAKP